VSAEAVFIELPGDTRPEAEPALVAMFAEIRRRRPATPLTGALVVHRADALLADDAAVAAVAAARTQLDAAAYHLAAQVPVLLVVSQLDRVAGFAELLAGSQAATRALGTTLPPREGRTSVRAAVGECLGQQDGVLAWVHQRCHALVARAEPGSHRQSRLYGFWQQFDRLAARLAEAAGQLAAAPLPGGDPLRVRGVYFTSARPDPVAPEDLWASRLATRSGGALPPTDADVAPPPAAFVADLFRRELPRDGQYAARLRGWYRRRFTVAACFTVALAAAAAAVARGATQSARTNEALLQQTLDSAAKIGERIPDELPDLADLDVLRRAALTWRAPDAPDGLGWGLFRGAELAAVASEAYRGAVCRGVLRPLALRADPPLRQFAARYTSGGLPGSTEYQEAHDRLRSYLLLTDPPDDHEPAPWSEDQARWLRERLVTTWSDVDPEGPDPRRAAVLAAHVDLLIDGAGDGDDACARTGHHRAAERDQALVAAVRQILLRSAPERDLVDRMTDRINRDKRLRGVSVRDLTTANYLRGEVTVQPAFTRAGWDAFYAALGEELDERSDQPWVPGRPHARDSRSQRCTKLRNLYVSRYIDAWEAFARGLELTSPATLPQAASIYQELGEDQPLTPAFAAVAEHTQGLAKIPCADSQASDTWLRWAAPPPALPAPDARDAPELAREFVRLVEFSAPPPASGGAKSGGSSPLDSYHKRLQDIRSVLDNAIQNTAERPALCSELGDAIGDVEDMLQRGNLGGWKDPLTSLLLPPLTSLSLLCSRTIGEGHNKEWCETVVLPLQRTLVDKYPFVAARVDARLADVELLFHPQTGEIAKFRDKLLTAYVEVNGHDVTPRALGTRAELHLNPAVVELLDAAHELGLLLYGNGAVGLDAGMTMRCERSVNKVILRVDEAANTYFCSVNQSQQIHWPGKGEPRRAELEAFGANARSDTERHDGEFALFRLLEGGTPTHRTGQSTFTISLVLPRQNFGTFQLTFQPREYRGGNLFYGFSTDRFLAPFRAPAIRSPPDALFSEIPYRCHDGAPAP
jgi:type VI secretion system protein ImpL